MLPNRVLDVVDAALRDPTTGEVYLFRGDRYVAFADRRALLLPDGRVARRLGIDGFTELPAELRSGIDAALWDDGVWMFRGPWCSHDNRLGRLGIDAWQRLPRSFHAGIDTVLRANDRTLFTRGTRYVEYETGVEGELARAPDAVLDAFGSTYAFLGRDYARWDPDTHQVVGPLHRIGAPYGRGLPSNKGGGWLGASHLIAGPMISGSSIWVWTIDRDTLERLRLRVSGELHTPDLRALVTPRLRPAVDAVWPGSQIALLEARLEDEVELVLDDRILDRLELPRARAAVTFVVGSCADLSTFRDAPVFDRMAEHRADAALLLGDNCYYVNALGQSSDSFWKGGFLRADWDDPARMLKRQLAARNQPELASLARSTPMHATWDDHDFGYNNATGFDRNSWVGRELAADIHRAMWGAPYQTEPAIYYAVRVGPVHVFITDSRYAKNLDEQVIFGETQLGWLLDAMAASDAPLKILASSTQLLYRQHTESFPIDAPGERSALLAAFARLSGRVLVVSGDVHYSELSRAPISDTPQILELTSSGIRTGESDDPLDEWVSGARIWAAQADAYGVVIVDAGTVTLEARDARGELLRDPHGQPCRTIWNLATGALS